MKTEIVNSTKKTVMKNSSGIEIEK